MPAAVIERLEAGDLNDLVIVVMRKNSALKILPILAANASPLFLFLMNNAAGPNELLFVNQAGLFVLRVLFDKAGKARSIHPII